MEEHAFLAPSGAGCTVHCAAAPFLQAKCPEDKDSDAAREGVAAHWVIAQLFDSAAVAAMVPGIIAPNGIVIDAEMIEAAELVYDDITEALGPHSAIPHVEETLQCPMLNADGKNWGTPDVWSAYADGPIWFIPVWDFKYGHGIIEVFENWQLINYGAAILTAMHLEEYNDRDIYFDFRIVQPRAYHMDGPIRRWLVKASDLRAQINLLRAQYTAALQPDPPAKPGPWCKENYCTAAGRGCNALAIASSHVIERVYRAQKYDMKAEELGLALHNAERAKKMLDAQVDGLRGQAFAMINRGDSVPYYSIGRGLGREVVPPEKVAEFIIVGEALGIDVKKPPTAITPKQARVMGMPADVVALYSKQNTGEKKLIADDGITARKVFR